MMKAIVITGVSTGIGYAATAVFIQRGYHVFGSVRKAADAKRLQAEMGAQFTPLLFDVTDKVGVQTAVSQVRAALGEKNLTALINNAGIVTPGPLMHMPSDSFRQQFQVNLFGLFDVTQAFLPLLGARKHNAGLPGRIINISSVSGKIAYPFMGAYAASKHALEAYSDSLRRELMLYGIDVILIQPGTTRTRHHGQVCVPVGAVCGDRLWQVNGRFRKTTHRTRRIGAGGGEGGNGRYPRPRKPAPQNPLPRAA